MSEPLERELPKLLAELAMFSKHAGAVDEARELWTGLEALQPDHEATHLVAGLIASKDRRFADAEQRYRAILEAVPEHTAARTFLAEALIGQKRWREATDLLHELEQEESDDPALVLAEALRKDLQAGVFHRQNQAGS